MRGRVGKGVRFAISLLSGQNQRPDTEDTKVPTENTERWDEHESVCAALVPSGSVTKPRPP